MSGCVEGPPDMKLPPGALFLQSLFVFPLRLKACVNCNPATKSGICIPIEFRLRWRSRSAASLTFALSQ
jgi:hypothetical protein